MSDQASRWLTELERVRDHFGDGAGEHKIALLRRLEKRRLPRAPDVLRLHEALCFLRAYPDDATLLAQVERMLETFATRSDLRRHRRALSDTGIAGTAIRFGFFPATAFRLARRWGRYLSIDWTDFEQHQKLEQLLARLALFCEGPALDVFDFGVRGWIEQLKGPAETDAEFVLRRLEQLHMSPVAEETLFEDLDMSFELAPGPDTPARTREKYARVPIVFQSGALRRSRPSVTEEVTRPPDPIRTLSPGEGRKLAELAQATMVTRARDIDSISNADGNDVRLVDCGAGLQIGYLGVRPERRLLLESLYGFVVLQNGVPVAYGAYVALFGSVEIAFAVFDTFRAGEAHRIYARLLANAHHVFGCDVFIADTYQIGQDNEDALESGAWWFYQKLGFRPRSTQLLRLMRSEEKRMKTNPAHRSNKTTLKKLAGENLYLYLGRSREDVLGVIPLENVALRITEYLAKRFGYDRRRAERTCASEAAERLGLRSLDRLSRGERLAWKHWSPLILILPGIERWSREDKRALTAVVRAKGGRCESEYLLRFDRHRRLRRAIRALAKG